MGLFKSKKAKPETEPSTEPTTADTKEPKKVPIVQDQVEELVEATFFKKEELQKWHKDLKKYSTTRNLNKEQFTELFNNIYYTHGENDEKIDYIFNSFNQDDDGEISFDELMMTLSLLKRGTIKDKMEWLFTIYDIDGNGSISRDELLQIVDCLRNLDDEASTRYKYSSDHMNQVFGQIDTSGDDLLSMDEFVKGVENYPELVSLLSFGQTLPLL